MSDHPIYLCAYPGCDLVVLRCRCMGPHAKVRHESLRCLVHKDAPRPEDLERLALEAVARAADALLSRLPNGDEHGAAALAAALNKLDEVRRA